MGSLTPLWVSTTSRRPCQTCANAVPDLCRCLVDGESALARNPERGISRDTGRGEHLLHITINLIRVEAVSIVRGAEASVLDHTFGPGLVVVAHRARHSLHSL